MPRPALQFSHANGFPAATYRQLFGHLEAHWRIRAIPAIGMDPQHPPTEGWPLLLRQLVADVERHHTRPVLAVGHSLGGFLSFMAAATRPDLFRAVILLDAPILGPIKGRLFAASKRLGFVDRVTPAGATRERRAHWDSLAQAEQHFRGKKLFRHFAPECLRDYVRYGLEEREGALRLVIDPAVETQIYRTTPHDMHRHLSRLKTPMGFIGGADSDVVQQVGLATMRRAGIPMRRLEGGHLFPFEDPAAGAAAIQRMAGELGAC